jgi:hypothetical protein
MQHWQCACCAPNRQAHEHCARAERHVITVSCEAILPRILGLT